MTQIQNPHRYEVSVASVQTEAVRRPSKRPPLVSVIIGVIALIIAGDMGAIVHRFSVMFEEFNDLPALSRFIFLCDGYLIALLYVVLGVSSFFVGFARGKLRYLLIAGIFGMGVGLAILTSYGLRLPFDRIH